MGALVAVNDPSNHAKQSVVLVDDSNEVRALVRRSLESSGLFEVVAEGGDGEDAFRLVHQHEPALLLLDTSMPTVDGVEVLPAIVALHPDTKVVVFTGFAEPGLADRVRELGASDIIEKSLPLEELSARLMRTLGDAPPIPPQSPRRGLRLVDGVLGGQEAAGERGTLDEHVQQFRELFDRAAIGMATLTVSGTIVRANRALANLMSCEPYDLVGVDYGQLTEGAGDRLDGELDAIRAGVDLATFEHRLPTPPGEDTTQVVRVTLAPIRDSARQVLYVFAQVQDISAERAAQEELRRSEETFRLLVTAVGEYAIFMLDVEGNVISWNFGAQRIKGYSADEIVGRSFRVFYPAQEQAIGHPEHNLQIALRDGSYAEEGWRVRKDESQFWASVVITAVYDDSGRHIGFAKVTRDQTKQREHEEERKATFADQAHLLAVTAHELRNPTAVIDGASGALRASWQQMRWPERDGLLAGIRSSAMRLRRLISDLATASRLHDGDALQLRLEEVSLTATLRSAAARARAAEPTARIECEVVHEAVFPADAARLGQALDNLLDNAVRHGASPVTLTADAGNEGIRIRLTDAGPGAQAELVPHLFERFAIAGPSGGTGLGLYLVREIVRGHDGRVEYLPPSAGQPTAFEIRLPSD